MIRPAPTIPVLILAAALTAACAGSLRAPGQTPTAVIVVDNRRATNSTLTIDLISAEGPRSRLGDIPPRERREFQVRRTLLTGHYQLEGRHGAGGLIVSRSFTLTNGDEILWDVERNRIWFQGNREGR